MRRLGAALSAALARLGTSRSSAEDGPASQGYAGDWAGTLGGTDPGLPRVLHVDADAAAVTLDSPSQGASGLPASETARRAVRDGALVASWPDLGASFSGRLSPDGERISGRFSQGGRELAPDLVRADAADLAPPARTQDPERPPPYREEAVRTEVPGTGVTLSGTLTLPVGTGPFPGVVLISGSGAHDRDETLHRPPLLRCAGRSADTCGLSVPEILAMTRRALTRHGANASVAESLADAVARAEATGNPVCGLYYLDSYCAQLDSGRVRGDVEPDVSRPRPGTVRVDAADGFAQPAFLVALPEALAAARDVGVASLAIRRAHTCTALGWFTERVAREGVIGIGMTNASPIVAPPGGRRRVIGTNPIAFAVPDGEGGVAVAFDQSTTQVALGRITMARAAGRAIPEGWALDADGQPTTDPEAALAGSLASAGMHKGWGLGVMVELLAAGMTGGRLSRDVAPLKAPEGEPHGLGQYFLLIDPGTSEDFGERLAGLVAEVEADGAGRLPGRDRAPAGTVEVPDALWTSVRALAEA